MEDDRVSLTGGRSVTLSAPGIRVAAQECSLVSLRDGEATDIAVIEAHDSRWLDRTDPELQASLLMTALDRFGAIATPAERELLDPASIRLGPWRPPAWLTTSPHLSEVTLRSACGDGAPLILASLDRAWVDGLTLCGRVVTSVNIDPLRPRRMMLESDRHIVKAEVASLDYCERSEVHAEETFIRQHSSATAGIGLPDLVAASRGRAVQTLVRERLPGRTLADLDDAERSPSIARATLHRLRQWAAADLHHNDLRPWNVLWDGAQCHFIDYSDSDTLVRDASGLPEALAVAALLAWVCGHSLPLDDSYADAVFALAPTTSVSIADRDERLSVTSPMLDAWERVLDHPDEHTADRVLAFGSHPWRGGNG